MFVESNCCETRAPHRVEFSLTARTARIHQHKCALTHSAIGGVAKCVCKNDEMNGNSKEEMKEMKKR